MDNAATAEASLTQKTITGTVWLLLWRVVTRSLGFVSTLVLARLLIPADFGLIAMATTFAYGIEALSQLGLQDALVRRREDGFDLHHTAFTLQLGRAVVTAVAVAAAAPAAAWWFTEPRLQTIVLVLAAVTVLNGLENVGMAEYRRAMRFDVQFKVNVVTRVAGFVVTIGCALAWGSYWALLAGIAVSSVARVAMSYRLHPFRPRLQLTRWREMAHFSFWTWATAIVSLIWERCDPFILGPKLGTTRVGLYLLAAEIATLPITELVAPAADALFTAFARAQKDGKSSIHHAPVVAGIILLAVAPVALGLSAASGPVVELLLGAKWSEAWPVVAIMAWACPFAPYSFICSMALVANGHVRRNFAANVIVSVIKLSASIGLLLLTTDLLAIGATAAACVAVESVAFLTMLRGTGAIRLRPALGGVLRTVASTGLAAAVIAWSGLGWQAGAGSLGANLTRGVLIGAMSVAAFASAALLFWLAAGRPNGAEQRLFQLAGPYLVGLMSPWRVRRGT